MTPAPTCHICLEEGELIQPCKCSGTSAHVHALCLQRWLEVSDRTSCEICKHEFDMEELQETECQVLPAFRLSEKKSTRNLLVVVGFVTFFLLTSFALITDEGFLEVFVLVNGMQMLLLFCMMSDDVNAGETLFVWKLMSSLAFAMVVFLSELNPIAELEWIMTACVGAIVYCKLATQKQTYRVLYLDYINQVET